MRTRSYISSDHRFSSCSCSAQAFFITAWSGFVRGSSLHRITSHRRRVVHSIAASMIQGQWRLRRVRVKYGAGFAVENAFQHLNPTSAVVLLQVVLLAQGWFSNDIVLFVRLSLAHSHTPKAQTLARRKRTCDAYTETEKQCQECPKYHAKRQIPNQTLNSRR